MGDFLTYTNKLRQWVPSLSPEQSEDFINDAWRDIREANDQWSFLKSTQYWLSPGSVSLLQLTVTQFSATVGLSFSALLALGGLNNPPVTQRQLRFGLSGGPIYGIASSDVLQVTDGAITSATDDLVSASGPFDASHVGRKIIVRGAGTGGQDLQTTILAFVNPTQVQLATNALTTVINATVIWGSSLTLDRVFNEQSLVNAAQALLYRIYYSPLSADFQKIDHLTDNITGYEFGYEINPIDLLDRVDPQRSNVREPYQIFFKEFSPVTGLPVYELWPGPTLQRAYTVTFWRLGLPFAADSDALPPQLTEELLITRARILAYEWGEVNDPDPKRRDSYARAKVYARSRYSTEGDPRRPLGLLDHALRRDEEVSLKQQRMSPRRPGPGWPVDSNFAQSHAIPAWWGGR